MLVPTCCESRRASRPIPARIVEQRHTRRKNCDRFLVIGRRPVTLPLMTGDTIHKLVSQPLVATPDLATATQRPESDIRWRALGALAVFRLLIALLLAAVFLSSDSPRFFGDLYPQAFLVTALIWFVAAVVGAIASATRALPVDTQMEMLLLIDITAIVILSLASGGASSGVAGLLIVFMAAGAFVLSGLSALFFAALATMGVLVALEWTSKS